MENELSYRPEAQWLIAHLTAMEMEPAAMARSETTREQAEAFIASFVQGVDEPPDPERFCRIAQRVSGFIVKHEAVASDDMQAHLALLAGISAIFDEESVSVDPE